MMVMRWLDVPTLNERERHHLKARLWLAAEEGPEAERIAAAMERVASHAVDVTAGERDGIRHHLAIMRAVRWRRQAAAAISVVSAPIRLATARLEKIVHRS